MKIIVLGAGQVGGTLAENLTTESFDITVVDTDQDRLRELRDRLDIQTIAGMASHPDVLRRAGAEDADMLIAVTNSDEVNIVACQVSHTLYRTPTKLARIRSSAYLSRAGLFAPNHIPVDVLINPEQVVTEYIRRLIENPGALQVLDFADSRVQLVAVKVFYGGPLVDRELRLLRQHMPNVPTRIVAIFRRDRPIEPLDHTVLEVDDEVFFLAARRDIATVMKELRRAERPYRRIMIAGGGNVGERLATAIEHDFGIKIIEYDMNRCRYLAEKLDRTVVLQGDATNRELMLDENIENTDVFCALTNDDEANVMSAMLAKRLGARKVMALISKPAYVDLVQGGTIDVAISPQQATISSLLTHIRRGDVARVHSLRRGAAEAIETIAHGNARSSRVVGRAIRDVPLPPGTLIGAVVRADKVFIGDDDLVIEPDDHIILFLVDKNRVHDVEQLFQVGFDFF